MRNTGRNILKGNRLSVILPILTIIGIGIITAIAGNYDRNWIFDWSGIRKEIKASVEIIKHRGISRNHVLKNRLISESTQFELIKLTEYPNGTVRAIAYEGLLKNKEIQNKFDLIIKAIKDQKYPVSITAGCHGLGIGLGEYIVWEVLNIDDQVPPLPPEFTTDFELTVLEKEKILLEFRNSLKNMDNHQGFY